MLFRDGAISIILVLDASRVRGHEDHEGFCAAVLPAYPTTGGVDVGSFVLCECEESHSTRDQTLVVCRYDRVRAGDGGNASTTGSCDAKICLFTQDCEMPAGFRPDQLDAKAFDYSVLDRWCVDRDIFPSLENYGASHNEAGHHIAGRYKTGQYETTPAPGLSGKAILSPPTTSPMYTFSLPPPNPKNFVTYREKYSASNQIYDVSYVQYIAGATLIYFYNGLV